MHVGGGKGRRLKPINSNQAMTVWAAMLAKEGWRVGMKQSVITNPSSSYRHALCSLRSSAGVSSNSLAKCGYGEN